MAIVNQGMSVEEIEQIVAQRVANAIEAIAIYESINQTKQRENKVAGNASNIKEVGKRPQMEALTNNTKGIRCLGHTLLGQTTRNMLGPYLYATSANVTTMARALHLRPEDFSGQLEDEHSKEAYITQRKLQHHLTYLTTYPPGDQPLYLYTTDLHHPLPQADIPKADTKPPQQSNLLTAPTRKATKADKSVRDVSISPRVQLQDSMIRAILSIIKRPRPWRLEHALTPKDTSSSA
ncbi:hypothetical protein Tco_1202261 [Tanacetum coccineum]